jgi:TonB-dependent SusC/RagA subfamily outer membrane receptor
MDYLLKSSAVIFIFYACYTLFLQRDTFFDSNRWFLLSGLFIASCIPCIVIPVYVEYTPLPLSEFIITNVNDSSSVVPSEEINFLELLSSIYIIGLVVFMAKLTIELLSLNRILQTGSKQSIQKFKFIETNREVTPFSFFNYIVYNPNHFNDTELQHIINHEKAHIQQLHSIDTIIAQIACVILWFNPFVWLYKKALQQNLEFIADQKAQYVSPCEKSYQTVLLKACIQNNQLVLTNNFYTSLIKKRIVMLHKSKSKKRNQLKLILVLPLLAFFIMSFSTETIYVETVKENNQSSNSEEAIEIIITKDTSDEDLESIKKELQSKGITFTYEVINRNSDGEITVINTTFKNDKNATKYNILEEEGIKPFRFISSDNNFSVGTIDKKKNTFIYETTDGRKIKGESSRGTNVYVFETDDDNENSEKVKIIKSKVIDSIYYSKPHGKANWINNNETETNIHSPENKNVNVFITKGDEPIFILNGKKVEKAIFEDVDSEDIESVFVLKGKNAVEKFGDEGKHGAIIITKKGSKDLFSETEDKVILNSKNSYTFETDSKQPLYILNGNVIDKDDLYEVNPNSIEKVEVLKDKSATTLYGKKGENGVIVIKTKKQGILNSKNKGVLVVKEDENPYQIEVSNVFLTYDDEEVATEFIITKNSSDSSLERQKAELKKHGIDAKFSKVKRNKAGEITSIKISLDDNDGRKSSASWKEKNQAIPDIVMGKSMDDKLYIRAIGN